ncbi:MAG: PAS domain-containing protein [Deltaproteobacteria bacterium]|nr:MAG: PAS domain-containing protein [Deltaproteobacteria bacterium]
MTKKSSKKGSILKLRWEEIFNSFGEGLMILNEELHLVGINPTAEQLIGTSADQLLGYTLEQAFPENEKTIRLLENSFEEGGGANLREVSWMNRKREHLTIDLLSTPLINDDGVWMGWIVAIRDLTPLKKLQEEIRRADRLATMGTLASGLAHEIKNPLGGIRGAAQLLQRDKLSEESQEYLQIIIKESDRVNHLITELLTFAKPKNLQMVPVNLNELLDATISLESLRTEKKTKFIREYDPSIPPVLADPNSLKQVLINMIKNASEALPDKGGEIRIRSRIDNNYKIRESMGERSSRMVVAEIMDNGVGIPKENLEKIFTPFFTTKDQGHGLGLAMSQRIINEHGGFLRMESQEGKGTTVQIILRSAS